MRKIVIDIDCNKKTCGYCNLNELSSDHDAWCLPFEMGLKFNGKCMAERCEACLKAEQKGA